MDLAFPEFCLFVLSFFGVLGESCFKAQKNLKSALFLILYKKPDFQQSQMQKGERDTFSVILFIVFTASTWGEDNF